MSNESKDQARWRRLALVTGAALVLGMVVYLLWPPSRDDYRPLDLAGPRWQEFEQDYQNALLSRIPWTQDPKAIALRVTGFPNPDNTQPARVDLRVSTSHRAVVVIRTHNLPDDSVQQIETRVELVREMGVWKVEWAGQRFLCYRGPDRGWTSGLCP